MRQEKFTSIAVNVLYQEADGLHLLANSLGTEFDEAIECLLHLSGRIAVTGMGKSGHIAKKVAATLSSTGSPAFFIHPAEASHGDLGMLGKGDAVLAFSNSGDTHELVDIIAFAARHRLPLIAVTRRPNSQLGKNADYVLQLPDVPEACPIGCAPTTSTTMQLALGDALALTMLQARGFTPEDFRELPNWLSYRRCRRDPRGGRVRSGRPPASSRSAESLFHPLTFSVVKNSDPVLSATARPVMSS